MIEESKNMSTTMTTGPPPLVVLSDTSSNKKRKKSCLVVGGSSIKSNSIDLMSKSSCEFVVSDNVTTTTTTNLTADVIDDTARRKHSSMYELGQLSKTDDQLVPATLNTDDNNNNNKLRGVNFGEISFYKQMCSVTDWFDELSDESKNNLLGMLLTRCGPSQTHTLSVKMKQLHFECRDNCCDFVARLPRIVSTQIFSLLDPVSLARACQVNRQWSQIGEYDQLWKRLCHEPKWRFSPAAEEKQLAKYKDNDEDAGDVNKKKWKLIFSERYRVKRNWTTGKAFIKTFYGHEGAVSCVQFDDTRIVAGSAMGEIKVWNLDESNQSSSTTTSQSSLTPYLNLVGHSKMIRCLQLDGKLNRLYSGSADNTIKVWDLSEVYPTWSRVTCKMTFLGHSDKVRCLQVNGDILISGSYDHNLKIWDIKTGLCKNTLKGHTDSVLCLQFDHEKIISGSADQTIRLWNFEGECLKQLTGHKGSITCLHFDSQRIISGSLDFDIRFWNLADGQCIECLDWISKEGHKGAIRCLKADSQKIVSCSDDKTIKIWDIETMERLVTLKSHLDGVTCLQFNDFFILSGSFDTTLKLWDFSYY